MTRIDVGGPRPYPVVIGRDFGGLAPEIERPGFLVVDANVEPLWGAVVRAALGDRVRDTVVVRTGEAHKTLDTWASVVSALIDAGLDRGTPVLALGGGVTSDLAGFAAATALRGVPWVALPTTLLSMVDASIGGKTGVNLPAGKNLVGAFHPPSLVWMATQVLSTLPPRELRCGWGEVLKTALVGDPDLLDALDADLVEVVARCARVKARVVTADPEERGERIALNLGHTVAHALETASDGAIAHGEAVGVGLWAETRWALRAGVCLDPGLPDRIGELLHRTGLPTRVPRLPRGRLLDALRVDKKGAADKIRLPLAERAGRIVVTPLPRSQLPELLDEVPWEAPP